MVVGSRSPCLSFSRFSIRFSKASPSSENRGNFRDNRRDSKRKGERRVRKLDTSKTRRVSFRTLRSFSFGISDTPVCYRHRLPAILGSLLEVLEARLGGPFSTIWMTTSTVGDSKKYDVLAELSVERAAGEDGRRSRGASRSRCYRVGSTGGFSDSCQSPGSVSFRHPIRGVVAERSPSLIPRSRHTSLDKFFLLDSLVFPSNDLDRNRRSQASSVRTDERQLLLLLQPSRSPVELNLLSLTLVEWNVTPTTTSFRLLVKRPPPPPTASLFCSYHPFAAPLYDLKYITGYKDIFSAVGISRSAEFFFIAVHCLIDQRYFISRYSNIGRIFFLFLRLYRSRLYT